MADPNDTVKGDIMIITPYREQEARFNDALDAMRAKGELGGLEIDVCTLDRCQGREATIVYVSLVRGRASKFFDMPKRWNVALTRAKDELAVIYPMQVYGSRRGSEYSFDQLSRFLDRGVREMMQRVVVEEPGEAPLKPHKSSRKRPQNARLQLPRRRTASCPRRSLTG